MNFSFEFDAIGTHWTIDIYRHLTNDQQDRIQTLVHERIAVFDHHYSRFKTDSLIWSMAQKAGAYTLPSDAKLLLELYRTMYELTDGQMTPLVGQLLSDAGYDKDYSLKEAQTLSTPPPWSDAIEYPYEGNSHSILIKQAVLLDVGAIGKGYLIDIVGNVLEQNGYPEFCIDASGDILYKKNAALSLVMDAALEKPLRIGLENPFNTSQIVGIAELQHGGFAGSAGNRRKWGRFNHIIDPKTRTSPDHIKAVWTVAESAMLADALTTALYFCDPSKIKTQFKFEYVIMYADHSVDISDGFPGTLFNH